MLAIRRSFRSRFMLGALACLGLMGYALYSQYVKGLDPCPLCIFQRVAMIALGLVFALGALFAPKSVGGRRAFSMLALLVALVGSAISARHLWIQMQPAGSVPACGASLDFMLHAMSFSKVLMKVFTGSGECAQVTWRFLGLSMPGWVLISFVVLAIWAMVAGFRRHA
jgi:disulfide bond formation protein DsbB